MTPAYINVVLETYNLKREQGEIDSPTPANLKRFSVEAFGRFNRKDGRILKRFFGEGDDPQKLQHLVERKDPEDFRAVQNYLSNETANPRETTVELAAWLIDFEPRPYKSAFDYEALLTQTREDLAALLRTLKNEVNCKKDSANESGEESGVENVDISIAGIANEANHIDKLVKPMIEEAREVVSEKESDNLGTDQKHLEKSANNDDEGEYKPEAVTCIPYSSPQPDLVEQSFSSKLNTPISPAHTSVDAKKKHLKIIAWPLALVMSAGISYFALKKDQCMYWAGDHYERVACDDNRSGLSIIAADEAMIRNFKKITRPDTLTLKDINRVFYGKIGGEFEYFTAGGFHPVHLSRGLKPLTEYIIEKHIVPLKSKELSATASYDSLITGSMNAADNRDQP